MRGWLGCGRRRWVRPHGPVTAWLPQLVPFQTSSERNFGHCSPSPLANAVAGPMQPLASRSEPSHPLPFLLRLVKEGRRCSCIRAQWTDPSSRTISREEGKTPWLRNLSQGRKGTRTQGGPPEQLAPSIAGRSKAAAARPQRTRRRSVRHARTKPTAFFNACYSSRMAPWRTVICVTGSPELFNSLRI